MPTTVRDTVTQLGEKAMPTALATRPHARNNVRVYGDYKQSLAWTDYRDEWVEQPGGKPKRILGRW